MNASDDFKLAIKRLHAEKDRAYGGAWKRRGELVSILPNIARKADRLENLVQTGATMRGESLLDTVIDLYVYVEKYRLFLAEHLEDNDRSTDSLVVGTDPNCPGCCADLGDIA